MPQPNINKMLKQVQQMQAEMMKAQEQLKDEGSRPPAGGGMVTVKMSGDLRGEGDPIDPARSATVDRRGPRDAAGHGPVAAVNEAIRSAQELASRKLGGLTGGLGASGWLGLAAAAAGRTPPRPLRLARPPVNRLITELAKLPGIGQRTAQRLAFHLLRACPSRGARRSPTRSAR